MDEYYSLIKAEHDANNAWSAEQAQKAMDYQTEMSNTAHQREVADLKAAGLNPVLSAGGSGATTGSGLQASRSDENVNALYGLAKQAIDANIKQAEALAQTAKFSSGSGSSGYSGINGDNSILSAVVNAVADLIYRKTGIKPQHSIDLLNTIIPDLDGYDTERLVDSLNSGSSGFFDWLDAYGQNLKRKWLIPHDDEHRYLFATGIGSNSAKKYGYDLVTHALTMNDHINNLFGIYRRNYHSGGNKRRYEKIN